MAITKATQQARLRDDLAAVALSGAYADLAGKRWQVLNEDGTDWDEQATAEQYHAEQHDCKELEQQ